VFCAPRHKSDAVAAGQKSTHDCKPNAACSHKDNVTIALIHARVPGFNHPRACSHLTPLPVA
jgi:hypothetical protein